MSDIKDKIKMDTKQICDMMECLTKNMQMQFDMGVENVNTAEAKEVIDMIKDLAEAKCSIVKAMYHEQIMQAMEDADSDDVRYYQDGMRGSQSRNERNYRMPMDMYRSYDAKTLRDMDKRDKNVMYYTEPMSRYDNAKRAYTENKLTHAGNTPEDNQSNTKMIDEIMNILHGDMDELLPKMTSAEKTYLKSKMNNMMNDIR